jgi:hypothetical protein
MVFPISHKIDPRFRWNFLEPSFQAIGFFQKRRRFDDSRHGKWLERN